MLNFIDRYWRWFTAIFLLLISVASLTPLPVLPEMPGSDKTHHLIAYAALAFPAALNKMRHWWRLIILFAIWSGVIELIQPYVNRYGEWQDLLANCIGLLIGVAIAMVLRGFRHSPELE